MLRYIALYEIDSLLVKILWNEDKIAIFNKITLDKTRTALEKSGQDLSRKHDSRWTHYLP